MNKVKPFALLLGVLIISLTLSYIVSAWTEPSQVPPGGNVPAPLNISTTDQSKPARLDFTEFHDYNNTAYYVNPSATVTPAALFAGTVGIGTSAPSINYKLDIVGGGIRLRPIASVPLAQVGVVYYDSTTDKFRCYEGGSWKDCIGGGGSGNWTLCGNVVNTTVAGNPSGIIPGCSLPTTPVEAFFFAANRNTEATLGADDVVWANTSNEDSPGSGYEACLWMSGNASWPAGSNDACLYLTRLSGSSATLGVTITIRASNTDCYLRLNSDNTVTYFDTNTSGNKDCFFMVKYR